MMSAMAVRMSEGVRRHGPAESDEESVPGDRTLLEALAKGERWAADALYDTLYPSVARTLQRVLNDPRRDYEDLVQTTFERIMIKLLGGSIAEVLNLRAWASG